LPVVLTSFTAVNQMDHTLVSWEIEGLEDLDYFEMERSVDGKSFSKTATIERKENRASSSHYEWVDDDVYPGLFYYRLKIVQLDGEVKYSNIEVVEFKASDWASVQLAPNPAAETVHLLADSRVEMDVNLSVYSVKGELVMNKSFGFYKGVNDYLLNVSDLSPGIYLVRLYAKNQLLSVQKLVKY
jgi:Secretion system C-terminal sorting domain